MTMMAFKDLYDDSIDRCIAAILWISEKDLIYGKTRVGTIEADDAPIIVVSKSRFLLLTDEFAKNIQRYKTLDSDSIISKITVFPLLTTQLRFYLPQKYFQFSHCNWPAAKLNWDDSHCAIPTPPPGVVFRNSV